MYHLYHTPAFVLKTSISGEANRHCVLFTRELGLIKASVQGVCLLKSKLRPALLDFSHSSISLVRGKSAWRITSAIPMTNIYKELRGHKNLFEIFARMFALLSRLLQEEEKNEELFEHVLSAYRFALSGLCTEDLSVNFEYVLVLRILHSLGYVGSAPHIAEFINSPYWSDGVLRQMEGVKTSALLEINKSLKASQL